MRRNFWCDPLEINVLQVALDHLKEHLLEVKAGESAVKPGEFDSEIEMRLETTNNLISALASAEDLTLKIN